MLKGPFLKGQQLLFSQHFFSKDIPALVGVLQEAGSPVLYWIVSAGAAEMRSGNRVTSGLAIILDSTGPLLMAIIVIKLEMSTTVLSLLFKKMLSLPSGALFMSLKVLIKEISSIWSLINTVYFSV